jgi:hypothetical protein
LRLREEQVEAKTEPKVKVEKVQGKKVRPREKGRIVFP